MSALLPARSRFTLSLRSLIAAGGIALVMFLAALAVSPQAHEHLHVDASHPDHDCAVVLYAHGVSPDIALLTVAAPTQILREATAAIGPELLLVAPHYLRLPERGPPVD